MLIRNAFVFALALLVSLVSMVVGHYNRDRALTGLTLVDLKRDQLIWLMALSLVLETERWRIRDTDSWSQTISGC